MSSINELGTDLLQVIAEKLPLTDVCRFGCVSKTFASVLAENEFWRKMALINGVEVSESDTNARQTFKEAYGFSFDRHHAYIDFVDRNTIIHTVSGAGDDSHSFAAALSRHMIPFGGVHTYTVRFHCSTPQVSEWGGLGVANENYNLNEPPATSEGVPCDFFRCLSFLFLTGSACLQGSGPATAVWVPTCPTATSMRMTRTPER